MQGEGLSRRGGAVPRLSSRKAGDGVNMPFTLVSAEGSWGCGAFSLNEEVVPLVRSSRVI